MIILDVEIHVVSCLFIVGIDYVMAAENLHLSGTVSDHSMGLTYRGLDFRYEGLYVASASRQKLLKLGRLRKIVIS